MMITDHVGSFKIIHGTIPSSAATRKYESFLGIFLKPYRKEKKKIVIVNISEAPKAIAATPAPFATCPKNVTPETIDQTNQV